MIREGGVVTEKDERMTSYDKGGWGCGRNIPALSVYISISGLSGLLSFNLCSIQSHSAMNICILLLD